MIRSLILLLFVFFSILPSYSSAQNEVLKVKRQVSGIIVDSLGTPISNVTIVLKSKQDSLTTSSDQDGIYIFPNVVQTTFTLSVTSVEFVAIVKKYIFNVNATKIVVPPITMNKGTLVLKEVKVNGTPTIVYKTDTVEYRANDYSVSRDANVGELLRKMEGIEVSKDGVVTHNGQQITKAKLNGKTFAGGDVAQAIKNLPALIVDKIQIVDDYGEQANRTGIKDGEAQKVINITTRADKSIGNFGHLLSEYGSNNRYNSNVFAQRINANQEIGVITEFKRTIDGIANTTSTTSASNNSSNSENFNNQVTSPGVTLNFSPTLTYRDNLSGRTELVANYSYKLKKNDYSTSRYGYLNYESGISDFKNNNLGNGTVNNHNLSIEINYYIDKFNFLQLSPSLTTYNSIFFNKDESNYINNFTSGFEHQRIYSSNNNKNENLNLNATALFVHTFLNPRKALSIQAGVGRQRNTIYNDVSAFYQYFGDTTENELINDSTSHIRAFRTNDVKTYQGLITFGQPLSKSLMFDYIAQIKASENENTAEADNVLDAETSQVTPYLKSNYNYTYIDDKFTLDMRWLKGRSALTLGISFLNARLFGSGKQDQQLYRTNRNATKLSPIIRYSYTWSKLEKLSLTYNGNYIQPEFQLLQPFTDRMDPNYQVVGNPSLKVGFVHLIRAAYNKYIPNSKINLSLNSTSRIYENRAAVNSTQLLIPLNDNATKTVNITQYTNLSGDVSSSTFYSVTKQLNDRKYSLSLNGSFLFNQTNALSNGSKYNIQDFRSNQRFGPKINPSEKLELYPFLGYEIAKTQSSFANAKQTSINTVRIAIDGKLRINEAWNVTGFISKNYVKGLTNYNKNPFVINVGLDKKVTTKNNIVVMFNAFDILHQNDFLQQTVGPMGTTYTSSSDKSRYFLIGVKFAFQRWGGTPMKDGKPMKRRGDGSFIP
ncbi:TonB-dependent receptor [Mucilaginibacter terrenus]|uniref:TonB-dependent receptor n=1 Tax=Mucilaginibacter terrenus TaxID=2482727 RepID=A0A3E2NSS3_9SPHI|nr:TonB-dependent receptor [Mucilaginibacter terrenus]RFZ84066.1 TonB-dependent receptor [Mucilaginibacter terrenus]